jgi:hypothetical protein
MARISSVSETARTPVSNNRTELSLMRPSNVNAVLLSVLLLAARTSAADQAQIAHQLEVTVQPDAGTLEVRDTLLLPDGRTSWPIVLHRDLVPKVVSGDAEITPVDHGEEMTLHRLTLDAPGPVTLAYAGRIRNAREQVAEGMGRTREWSAGTISPEGVSLDGNSGWYPRVPETLQTFRLEVTLPTGWTAVSQGDGPGDTTSGVSTWTESHPQDDIYLIAAPFVRYVDVKDDVSAQVYLRGPDDVLARRYLDATHDYVRLYSDLIGPYPFGKFALVENFWETGYGMPSFTLLGPQVIRLPFIIQTSYPHEILHNWWGNSVYIDYDAGNWAEGLTTYLADHLIRERAKEGWIYRRDTLKGYADYVREGEDFPVIAFRGRHGAASQAIGYGKSAMLFHMLRRTLGDTTFKAGLQRLYADHRFRVTDFDGLRTSFEAASGRDLADFFATWTLRTGAPHLRLANPVVTSEGDAFRVTARIEQTQSEAPFPLRVPVLVHQAEGDPVLAEVDMQGPSADVSLLVPSAPIRLAVDPWFDVFRALLPGETPVSLSTLFGAQRGLMVLPAAADEPSRRGYQSLAEAWQTGHPGWAMRWDNALTELPDDRPVWVLGWENRWRDEVVAHAQGVTLDAPRQTLQIAGEAPLGSGPISPVLTAWRGSQALGWLAASEPAALPGLARKLPHYGKYGYLIFAGAAPDNQLKGQWPSGDSELVHWFGERREFTMPSEPPALVP